MQLEYLILPYLAARLDILKTWQKTAERENPIVLLFYLLPTDYFSKIFGIQPYNLLVLWAFISDIL